MFPDPSLLKLNHVRVWFLNLPSHKNRSFLLLSISSDVNWCQQLWWPLTTEKKKKIEPFLCNVKRRNPLGLRRAGVGHYQASCADPASGRICPPTVQVIPATCPLFMNYAIEPFWKEASVTRQSSTMTASMPYEIWAVRGCLFVKSSLDFRLQFRYKDWNHHETKICSLRVCCAWISYRSANDNLRQSTVLGINVFTSDMDFIAKIHPCDQSENFKKKWQLRTICQLNNVWWLAIRWRKRWNNDVIIKTPLQLFINGLSNSTNITDSKSSVIHGDQACFQKKPPNKQFSLTAVKLANGATAQCADF